MSKNITLRMDENNHIRESALKRLNEGFYLGGTPLDRDDLYARWLFYRGY